MTMVGYVVRFYMSMLCIPWDIKKTVVNYTINSCNDINLYLLSCRTSIQFLSFSRNRQCVFVKLIL